MIADHLIDLQTVGQFLKLGDNWVQKIADVTSVEDKIKMGVTRTNNLRTVGQFLKLDDKEMQGIMVDPLLAAVKIADNYPHDELTTKRAIDSLGALMLLLVAVTDEISKGQSKL